MPPLRVYFDTCALKRGWDDQTQLRIKLEADAVVALLHLVRRGRLVLIHSTIHDVENAKNRDRDRRASVEELLFAHPIPAFDGAALRRRAAELLRRGFGAMDAAHLAAAEVLGADAFVTVDDRLLRRTARLRFAVRAVGPIDFSAEVAS